MLSSPNTLLPFGNSPFEKLLSSDLPPSTIFLPASFCIQDCAALPSAGELIPGATRGILLSVVYILLVDKSLGWMELNLGVLIVIPSGLVGKARFEAMSRSKEIM